MGWPLALTAGLMERKVRALGAALWPLTVGHLAAMLLVLLPFSALIALNEWRLQIQTGASICVIAFGIYRFFTRRHPRALARIGPARLGLWSFAVAIAHGAGLMLVPIYLGLCHANESGWAHGRIEVLINANIEVAVFVALVHSAAMISAGGALAFLVYKYLGSRFVPLTWFNLDPAWATSLVLIGSISLASVIAA